MKPKTTAGIVAILIVLVIAHSGFGLDGQNIVRLKKAGVSDQTIQVIVREKVIETAAFSVDEIIAIKKAGVGDKTLQMLITDGSFLKDREPIVYGEKMRSIRYTSPLDIIELKQAGLSDEVIKAIVTVSSDRYRADQENAFRLLESMGLRIHLRGGRAEPYVDPY